MFMLYGETISALEYSSKLHLQNENQWNLRISVLEYSSLVHLHNEESGVWDLGDTNACFPNTKQLWDVSLILVLSWLNIPGPMYTLCGNPGHKQW